MDQTKRIDLDRRSVLRGAGGVALTLPLLPSLLRGRAAAAATLKPAPRLVVMQNRDGTFPSQFFPADPATRFSDNLFHTRLTDIQGPLSPVLGTAFDDLRGKVNVFRGLDLLCFAFHQAVTFVSCSDTDKERFGEGGPPRTGSAADCIVEHSAGFYTTRPPLSALRISAGDRRSSYWREQGGRDGTPVLKPYLKEPQAVFDAVMSRAKPTAPEPALPTGPRPEKLITDHLLAEYRQFLGSTRLGAEDRRRVEQHYQLVHELQKSVLAAGGQTTGRTDACGALPGPPAATARVIDRYTAYTNAIVTAFACGVTRIAVLNINHFDDDGQVRPDVHHANSHATLANGRSPEDNCRLWDNWAARRVAALMKKLDEIKEPDGSTVLDNSVVLWGNEDGNGKSHSSESIPIVMGGSAGGRLRTGHYLDYRQRPVVSPGAGWPLAGLWIAVMTALGVRPEEYLRQGDAGGFGDDTASFMRYHKDADTKRKTPLPFLLAG